MAFNPGCSIGLRLVGVAGSKFRSSNEKLGSIGESVPWMDCD